MALADRLAADTAVLTLNLNALMAAAAVVVADTAAATTQPHVDALATAIAAITATRARMQKLSDTP